MDKKVLSQYQHLKQEVRENEIRVEKIQKELYQIEQDGIVIDSVKGSRKDGTYGSIQIRGFQSGKFFELERIAKKRICQLEDMIIKYEELTYEVEKQIQELDSARDRRVLTLRYIDGKKWEEICNLMNYSWKQVHRIHNNILKDDTKGH